MHQAALKRGLQGTGWLGQGQCRALLCVYTGGAACRGRVHLSQYHVQRQTRVSHNCKWLRSTPARA